MVSAGPLGSARLGNWELLSRLHGAFTSSRGRWRPGREGRGRAGPGEGGGASVVPSTDPQHAPTPPPKTHGALLPNSCRRSYPCSPPSTPEGLCVEFRESVNLGRKLVHLHFH